MLSSVISKVWQDLIIGEILGSSIWNMIVCFTSVLEISLLKVCKMVKSQQKTFDLIISFAHLGQTLIDNIAKTTWHAIWPNDTLPDNLHINIPMREKVEDSNWLMTSGRPASISFNVLRFGCGLFRSWVGVCPKLLIIPSVASRRIGSSIWSRSTASMELRRNQQCFSSVVF